MNDQQLTLISHHLCPYVQRSVITLTEKNIPHQRIYIDLSDKPDWFLALSPTGKVPLLKIDEREALFESAVICEYLDEITPGSLHPQDPLAKARHRAWIEFGSQLLNDIARLYNATSESDFLNVSHTLRSKIERLETLVLLPFFAGESFSLVDAAYGPIFRYFDVLDQYLPVDLFADCPTVQSWRQHLRTRPSVMSAVHPDYPKRLKEFLLARKSHLSMLIASIDRAGANPLPGGFMELSA